MTTNLHQPDLEDRIERVAREYYRQLSIVRIQDAIYFAGIPDETLECYCQIYARECITHQLRSSSDNQIVRRVHDGARVAHGRTIAEFAQCLTKAIEICNQHEEES